MILTTSIRMRFFNKAFSVLHVVSSPPRLRVLRASIMTSKCDPSPSSPDQGRLEHKDCEDKHSFAEPDKAVVRHISFTWDIDFTKSILKGAALLTFESYEPVSTVVLDISKDLQIQSAQLEDGAQVPYNIDCSGLFGGKLTVALDPSIPQGSCEIFCSNKRKEKKPKPKKKKKPTKKVVCDGIRSRCCIQPFYHCAHVQCIRRFPLRYDGFAYSVALARVFKKKRRDICTTPPPYTVKKCCQPCHDKLQEYKYRFKLRLNYNTTPAATGLQWLEPEQTSAKIAPFLFSQCQPIHARSMFPCQDSPQVKFTYDAEVTANSKYTVLMSALLTETIDSKSLTDEKCKTFKFYQPIPIPSYLVALAAGILKSEQIGPRTRVWAEPDMVEAAAWEFADTEKFISTAEKMFGNYVWGSYDLLVLPPSFPYGGMENPNLTFATPTLIAGDRSHAEVVIHEIMHSWTGNLVTNRSFEHFWLNEGFTVFLERRVVGRLWGGKHRDFESLLGYQELEETLLSMEPESNLSKLCPNLDGIHPDEAYSIVPYEKGSLFLRYLEDLVGGPKYFDDFIRAYIKRFERQSLNSDQFKSFFLKHFAGHPALGEVQWDAWLNKPGPPPNYPVLNAELTKSVQKLVCKIYGDGGVDFLNCSDIKGFSPHQIVYLLQEMLRRPPLEIKYLREIGKEYRFEQSKNTEIQYRWYRLCILSKDQARLPEIFEFLATYGRTKYVRPLNRDLYHWPEARAQAREHYLKTEKQFMFITRQALRKELHLTENCKDKSDGSCKCQQ